MFQNLRNNFLKDKFYKISKKELTSKQQNQISIFARDKCKAYINQIIMPENIICSNKQNLMNVCQPPPQNTLRKSRKRAHVIPLLICQKTKNQNIKTIKKPITLNSQRKVEKQNKVKSNSRANSLYNKYEYLCVPLQRQSVEGEIVSTKIIQLLRSIKQRDQKIEEKNLDKKYQQFKIQKERIKTFITTEKKISKQRFTGIAYGYDYDPIPIINDGGTNQRLKKIEMQVRVLDKNDISSFQKHHSNLKKSRKIKFKQDQTKKRVQSCYSHRFQDLEMQTPSKSDFFKNFYNLKLKLRVETDLKQGEQAERNKMLLKQTQFDKISTNKSKSSFTRNTQIKNIINVLDKQFIQNQLIQNNQPTNIKPFCMSKTLERSQIKKKRNTSIHY